MKKKNWLKIIAIITISLSCMIYIAVSLIHSHKVNNFVLRDSCVFEDVKTTHFNAPDQETSLYEQAEATYASYTDSERYELLEHSYLPPEDGRHLSESDTLIFGE